MLHRVSAPLPPCPEDGEAQDALAEARIDPADGRLRTLDDLHRTCAGRYTPAAIESYWETSCRPHVRKPFEGDWALGVQTHTIEGETLFWQCGRQTPIEVAGPTSFRIFLDGASHEAGLDDGNDGPGEGRQRLAWSDGETWQRQQEELRQSAGHDDLLSAPPPSLGRSRQTFGAGDRVKYWSNSVSKWLSATVRSQNADGTYELDIKKRADAALLRAAAAEGGPLGGGASAAARGRAKEGVNFARWRMQLPRALAEMHAGEPEAFERLLLARLGANPGQDHDEVYRDMLQDAVPLCATLGYSAEELEVAIRQVEANRAAAAAALPPPPKASAAVAEAAAPVPAF
mmetsp:Transcript_168727/g.542227  ORF Transcript_168727/g.542227 Transcript_168727/m.542227 type:complete len:344 (-) Transcript_168727:148-1179(-)